MVSETYLRQLVETYIFQFNGFTFIDKCINFIQINIYSDIERIQSEISSFSLRILKNICTLIQKTRFAHFWIHSYHVYNSFTIKLTGHQYLRKSRPQGFLLNLRGNQMIIISFEIYWPISTDLVGNSCQHEIL